MRVARIEIGGRHVSHAQFLALLIGQPQDDADALEMEINGEVIVVSRKNFDTWETVE